MELAPSQSHAGGLRGLLDVLWRIHTKDRNAVLGIIVGTQGSTYRKPGALVLLDKSGLRHGVISGGCLEPALEDAARAVHASGVAASVEFDTSSDEDLLFGTGIGCRGRVHMLLLPLPVRAPLARALFAVPEKGAALTLSLVTAGDELGAGSAAFAEDAEVFAWDARGESVAPGAQPSLQLTIPAPPQLLLLGAGPETASLATFAYRLGWFTNVVEHRGRWSAFARTAPIDLLIELAPEGASQTLANDRHAAAIVMSHNYSLDLAWLRHCAEGDIGYVGLLGPAARRDALLGDLGDAFAHSLRGRLHSPVGLDLGGHGGEAVALAIVAELQMYFCDRKKAGNA
ncbi:MAG: XdhC family protein [Rudaea sp.]